MAYLTFLMITVTGCDLAAKKAETLIKWSVTADGSYAWVHPDGQLAWKCLPQGKIFKCIWVTKSQIELVAHFFDIYGIYVSVLPTDYNMEQGQQVGYFCEYKERDDSSLDVYQAVTLGGETIDSKRSVSPIGAFDAALDAKPDAPWGKEYMDDLISRNKIKSGIAYFDCLAIGSALSTGSLATLKTNLIALN